MPSRNITKPTAKNIAPTNEYAIYGVLLSKVNYLKQNGWVVFLEHPVNQLGDLRYRLGTKLVNEQGITETYERVKARNDRQALSLETSRQEAANENRRGSGAGAKSKRPAKRNNRKGDKAPAKRRGSRKP